MCSFSVIETPAHYDANVSPGPEIRGKLPLIAWVQAGNWCDAEEPLEPGDAIDWLFCPVRYGLGSFVLKVEGDSMDDGSDEGYRDGELIYVDPTVQPEHNKDVVARQADGKAMFKRLQITYEGTYLLALNPHHPERKIRMPEGTVICGVVIFSGKAR